MANEWGSTLSCREALQSTLFFPEPLQKLGVVGKQLQESPHEKGSEERKIT